MIVAGCVEAVLPAVFDAPGHQLIHPGECSGTVGTEVSGPQLASDDPQQRHAPHVGQVRS